MTATNVERVREVYEHWSRGDWRFTADWFGDDAVYTTFDADGEEIVLEGADEMGRWFRGFLEQWRDFRQEMHELIDCGDRVLAVGRQFATGRASGAELDMRVYNVWVFRDGRLAELLVTRHEGAALRKAGINVR